MVKVKTFIAISDGLPLDAIEMEVVSPTLLALRDVCDPYIPFQYPKGNGP